MMATVCLAALPFRLAAQENGDVTEGRHLAGMYCSSCHIITPSAQAAGSNRVPTFSAIARRPSTTPASLRGSLLRPHPAIANLQATPDELRDLIAFILSLRGQ
jgi:mono/diheme cytochrome c family protein